MTTTTTSKQTVTPSAVVLKNGIPASLPSLDSLFNMTLTSKEREQIIAKGKQVMREQNHKVSLAGRMEAMVEALKIANPEDAKRLELAQATMKTVKSLAKSRKTIRDLADSKEVLRKANVAYSEESRLALDLLNKAGM